MEHVHFVVVEQYRGVDGDSDNIISICHSKNVAEEIRYRFQEVECSIEDDPDDPPQYFSTYVVEEILSYS